MKPRYALMPLEWADARSTLDSVLYSLAQIVDRGFRTRDQCKLVFDVKLNTGSLPISLDIGPAVPVEVRLLSAIIPSSTDAKVISGGSVTWEWRAGAVKIHALGSLAATTTYNAVIAVVE